MTYLNITPSMLEQFRAYKEELYGGKVTLMKLEDYLTRKFKPNRYVYFGTAFHLMIENSPENYLNGEHYIVNDDSLIQPQYFTLQEGELIKKYVDRHPNMIHEVPATKWIDVHDYKVRLSCKIDGVVGYELHEIKTKNGNPSRDNYHDSCQWRCYLFALPEAHHVKYDVFQIVFDKEKGRIMKPHRYTFSRYSNLRADVIELLSEFIQLCENRNLIHTLRPAWLVKRQSKDRNSNL